MAQKIDYQKIQSLKAKIYDCIVEIDNHTIAIQQKQNEIQGYQAEIKEEEAKKV